MNGFFQAAKNWLRGEKARGAASYEPGYDDGPVSLSVAYGDAGVTTMSANARMNTFSQYLNAMHIPNVAKAVNAITYAYASAPLEIVDETGQPVDVRRRAPDLWRLLEQPNAQQDGYTFFEQQQQDLQLTGNHIILMTEFDGFDRPHELYRLRPDQTRILVNEDRTLTYLFGQGSTTSSALQRYRGEWIQHWRMQNPTDPLWGMGTIEQGEPVFARDRLIGDLLRAYFERGAVLEGFIKLPGSITSDRAYNRLMERFRALRERGRASFRIGILEDGADYKQIQEPLGNIPIVDLAKMSRNDVLELFGVPPQKVGDFSDTNYRNGQSADAFFASETMSPLWERGERGWNPIVRRWDPRWRTRFRRPTVPVDIESRARAAYYLAQTASYRRNDIRALTGHQPFPDNDPLGTMLVIVGKNFQEEPDPTPELGPTDKSTGLSLPALTIAQLQGDQN